MNPETFDNFGCSLTAGLHVESGYGWYYRWYYEIPTRQCHAPTEL